MARLAGMMSNCRDLGMFVKHNKNKLRDYMTTGPARFAGIPANRAEIFPCNRVCRVIKPMRVQNQARNGFPRFIASAINRASWPHVIPG